MKLKIIKTLLIIAVASALPNIALASGSVSEFTEPLEKFANLLGGPWIKVIGMLGFIIAGASLAFGRSTLEDHIQKVLWIVIALSVVLAASSFVSNFFGFSGATIL